MTVQFHFSARAVALLLGVTLGVTLSSAVQAQTDGTAAILQKVTAAIQSLEKSCGADIKRNSAAT